MQSFIALDLFHSSDLVDSAFEYVRATGQSRLKRADCVVGLFISQEEVTIESKTVRTNA